jgi:sentrin-specific protease 1
VVEALARWVADEYRNKRGQEVDTSDWPRRYEQDIPQQHNGWDCGVFTLQVMLYCGRRLRGCRF